MLAKNLKVANDTTEATKRQAKEQACGRQSQDDLPEAEG